jgi:integrase
MKSVIKAAHVKTDQIDPTQDPRVSSMLKGIKKTRGHRAKKAAPILVADLNRGVQLVPDTLRGLRDKAMVLLGFAGALRRSEVVNIDVENLERLVGAIDDDGEHLPDALHVYISRSKGDREASGTQVTVFGATNKDVCPINTLYEWLAAAKILSGPTFLEMRGNRIMPRRASDQAVNKAVKDFVKRLGYDTAQYSGHSLRTGAITEMDRAGRTSSEGRRHSRHKSEEAYDGYVQRFNPWKDHPMRGIL